MTAVERTPLSLDRAHWQQSLQGDIGERLTFARKQNERGPTLRRVVVLEEVASTQDAPETITARTGTIVTALRQTRGRGRLGREWADTNDDGLALTCVLASNPWSDPSTSVELLAVASAVAAARAIEHVLGGVVGIKWPNDLVLRGRKLGGILIERNRDRTLLGIGINVHQRTFPHELQATATSIAQVAADTESLTRLQVLRALMQELEVVLAMDAARILSAYHSRDVLTGTRAEFATPTGAVEGEVCSVDPLRGLVVRTKTSEQFLPAATTSVTSWNRAAAIEETTGQRR